MGLGLGLRLGFGLGLGFGFGFGFGLGLAPHLRARRAHGRSQRVYRCTARAAYRTLYDPGRGRGKT